MQSVQGHFPPLLRVSVPSPTATAVTTSLCLLPELVSDDSLYFRTCLLTRIHARTHTHTCTRGRPLAHALHSALAPVCAHAPSGPSAVLCVSARPRLRSGCRNPFPAPLLCGAAPAHIHAHTERFGLFGGGPVAHHAVASVPVGVSTAVSAAACFICCYLCPLGRVCVCMLAPVGLHIGQK